MRGASRRQAGRGTPGRWYRLGEIRRVLADRRGACLGGRGNVWTMSHDKAPPPQPTSPVFGPLFANTTQRPVTAESRVARICGLTVTITVTVAIVIGILLALAAAVFGLLHWLVL